MTADDRPQLVHTWFGPDDAPLFGALHLPRQARAVAVIVPPVGVDMLIAHRSLRVLAARLAERGVAAFRIDLEGTGDSAGSPDGADQVPGWLASIGHATAFARASGASRVYVVGLRLGATLAASLDSAVDGLVLWDPCVSGSRFLRSEEMLFRVGVTGGHVDADEGGVHGPGTTYSPATVSSLRRLKVDAVLDGEGTAGGSVRPEVGRVLLAPRSESGGAALRSLAAVPGIEHLPVDGHPELFDWAALTVPIESIGRVADWIDEAAPSEPVPLYPDIRTEAVVARTADGREVRERVVRVGTAPMFGIVTEVEGLRERALVLTNAAPPAVHVGPARTWVEVARAHALLHGPVLRFDGQGTGESIGGDSARYPAVYTSAVVDDVVEAVRTARELASRVVVSGLCAAGWAVLRAAERGPVDAVVAVNTSVWDVHPAAPLTSPWPPPRQLPGSGRASSPSIKARIRHVLRRWATRLLPEPIWWRLARRGLIEAPAGMIVPLVRRGTRVHLLLETRAAARFARLRGDRTAARLARTGLLDVGHADEVDHALMTSGARRAVMTALTAS